MIQRSLKIKLTKKQRIQIEAWFPILTSVWNWAIKKIEVSSFNSTRTCSSCGSLTGPQGRAGLSVRSWTCTNCGSLHDRDVNAAINTLKAAVGLTVESDNRSHVRNHEVA